MNTKPATFNIHSVGLFTKTSEHINKEMNRRGLPYHSHDPKIEKVARIIWKDAYDAGVNDAHRGLAGNPVSRQKPALKPEVQNYLLVNNCHDEKYRVSLTTEQKAFWDWLNNHGFIYSDTYIEKWLEGVIEVGRIK